MTVTPGRAVTNTFVAVTVRGDVSPAPVTLRR